MTDVVLIHPNSATGTYQGLAGDLTAIEPPLWTRLIAGYLIDRKWDVRIIDAEAWDLRPEQVAMQVREMDPKLVVIVAFGHQPSASTQQMAGARAVIEAIRTESKELLTMLVGGHVSALPERTLQEEEVDFVCKGEGPGTIDLLLRLITTIGGLSHEAERLGHIPGLGWRYQRNPDAEVKIVINEPAPAITDLDADLHGGVWHLLPMSHYRSHNWQAFGDLSARQPYASIYTSLGCPYACSFCCINAPFGKPGYRMRSPAAVVNEIEYLYQSFGVKTFKIIDEMFVLNNKHVREICEGLAALPFASELNIWAYARVDTVREHMLPLLRAAGIRWLALGIESGSAHVRDGADKSFTDDEIVSIVEQIQKADINVIGNFIFGLPDDTVGSMLDTFLLAGRLNCEFVNFYSAMAYPGSKLYDDAIAQGKRLPESWSGYSQHSEDCLPLGTETVVPGQVVALRDAFFNAHMMSERYGMMLLQKFGSETREHVRKMAQHRLQRRKWE